MNYEEGFGWGGPNHIMTEISTNFLDKERELAAWEDKHQTVVFLTVCPKDVRHYYEDDILKDVTDDEIYEQLGEIENNLDLGEDYDMIINWVKNAVISVPRTDYLLEDNEDA